MHYAMRVSQVKNKNKNFITKSKGQKKYNNNEYLTFVSRQKLKNDVVQKNKTYLTSNYIMTKE